MHTHGYTHAPKAFEQPSCNVLLKYFVTGKCNILTSLCSTLFLCFSYRQETAGNSPQNTPFLFFFSFITGAFQVFACENNRKKTTRQTWMFLSKLEKKIKTSPSAPLKSKVSIIKSVSFGINTHISIRIIRQIRL